MPPFFDPNPKKVEGRFGFGTTEAVDALLRKLNATAHTDVMVAINIATMVRNTADSKAAKVSDIVTKVRARMNSIASEIADVCHTKWKDRKHHILFYLAATEKAVPQEFRRPQTSPTAIMMNTATEFLLKQLKPIDQEDSGVFAHVRLGPQLRVPSYKGIGDCISQFAHPGTPIHLISHMPMDYHVATTFGAESWLYRSHTGEVVRMTPGFLGQIVFKSTDIPFYPSTHVLFGDKYLMKPAVGLKERRQIQAYAQKEHWSMHTALYVKNRLIEYKFTLPYEIG